MAYSHNGITYGVHAAINDWAFLYSLIFPGWWEFEVREMDEWSGDAAREDRYNRSELGSFQHGKINGGEEFWVSWSFRGWGMKNAGSIFQIFSDQVELQLQSGSTGLAIHTWSYPPQSGSASVRTVNFTDTPIKDGRVYNIVIRMKSRNDGTAELQLWRNGVERCNLSNFSMGIDNPTNEKRQKIGLYRPRNVNTTIMQVANFQIGPDLRDKILKPDELPIEWASYGLRG